jgi:hypothetical protein
MTENCKLRKAILSAFYNILQRNFGILLILWCSFKLWWNFCLDLSSKFGLIGEWSIEAAALSSVYIIVFCVRKVFNNFTTEEKSLNHDKNLCFATDFSPDFANRKALTRVLQRAKSARQIAACKRTFTKGYWPKLTKPAKASWPQSQSSNGLGLGWYMYFCLFICSKQDISDSAVRACCSVKHRRARTRCGYL